MIKIDGSTGEGGGQIFRISLACSSLPSIKDSNTKNPIIELFNIRKGRPRPGLSAQHVECVKVVRQSYVDK